VTDPGEVITVSSVSLAEQCQNHAVRTAVQQIRDGVPSLALGTLLRSVRTCANLDNRPLSAERVRKRADELAIALGGYGYRVPPALKPIDNLTHRLEVSA
jgi:hypothetical protein